MTDPAADPTTALRAEIDRLREGKRQTDAALVTAQQERDQARTALATASQERDAAKQSATAWEAQGKLAAQLQQDLTAARSEAAGITAVSAAQIDMVMAGVRDPTVRDYLLHTYGAAVDAADDKPPAWADWWGAQRQAPSVLLAPFLAPAAPAGAPGVPAVSPAAPPTAPGAPPPISTGPSNTTLLNVPGRPSQMLGAPPSAPPAAPPAPAAFPANAAGAPGPDGSGVYRPGSIVAAVTSDPKAFAERSGMVLKHPERFARPG